MDDNNTETWRDSLTDEQRASNIFTNVKDLPDLFSQFQHAQSAMGQSLRVPGPDASAADQQKFYSKVMEKAPGLVRKPVADDAESYQNFWKGMGKPEAADAYSAIDGLEPEQTEFMRGAAFEADLTNEQFKKLAEKMAGKAAIEQSDLQALKDTKMVELDRKWGLSKPEKLQAINLMAGQLEMPEALREGMAGNPDVLEFMDIIVSKIGVEGAQMQTQIGENGSSVMTPVEAEAQINEIMSNREHDYWKAGSPGHSAAVRRIDELSRYADPQAGTNMDSLRSGFSGAR